MKRREFFSVMGSGVLGLAGVAFLANCSSEHQAYGGGGGGPLGGGNCVDNGVNALVELLHTPNHDLIIPKSDVVAGVETIYTLGDNGSGHIHQITLTAAHFTQLQNGQGVQVMSTSSGHSHSVTVNCA